MMANPPSGGNSTLVDEFLSSGAASARPMAAPHTTTTSTTAPPGGAANNNNINNNALYNSGSEEEELSGNRTNVGAAAVHAQPGNLRGSLNSSPTSGGLADELSQPLLSRQASSQNAQGGTNTTMGTATGLNSSSGSTPIGLMTHNASSTTTVNTTSTLPEGNNAAAAATNAGGPLFLDPAGMTHVVALQRLFVLMIEAQEIITRLQQFGYFPGKQFMADDPSGAVQMLVSLMTASMQGGNNPVAAAGGSNTNMMMGGGGGGGGGNMEGGNSPHMASPNTLLANNMNNAAQQMPAVPPGISGMPSALQMNPPLPCATSAPAALQGGNNNSANNSNFFPFGPNPSNAGRTSGGATSPFFDMAGGNEELAGQDPNAMWAFANAEANAATQPNQLDALLARAHEQQQLQQQQQQQRAAYGMMSYGKPNLMSMMGGNANSNNINTNTGEDMGGNANTNMNKSGLDSPHFDPGFLSSNAAAAAANANAATGAGGSGRNSHQNSSHSRHGRGSRNQRRGNKAGSGPQGMTMNGGSGPDMRLGSTGRAEGPGMFGEEGGNEAMPNHATNNNNTANNNNEGGHHANNNNNNNNVSVNPAEAVLAAGGIMACVEFKRGRIRKYACDLPDLTPGAYVLVDGDRGTDCGLLVQTARMRPDGMKSVTCMDGCDVKDEKLKLENGRVLRPASDDDIDRLHNIIANAEAVALKTCRQRCLELGIDIELVDVEYQFDMKKISFFFNCDHSVDFRALVRELYRTFGARIWMENINPKVKNAMPYPNEQNGAGQEGEGMTSGGGNRGHHGGYRRRN